MNSTFIALTWILTCQTFDTLVNSFLSSILIFTEKEPSSKHTTSLQHCNNVVDVQTTLLQRPNNVVDVQTTLLQRQNGLTGLYGREYFIRFLFVHRRIENWHRMVRDSGMKSSQRKRLQGLVNEKFQVRMKLHLPVITKSEH